MTKKKKRLIGWTTAILVVIIACLIGAWYYIGTPYTGAKSVWIYIPEDATREAMADSLTRALGPKTAGRAMQMYTAMTKGQGTAHGAYKVTPGMTAFTLARRLKSRSQTPVKFTFSFMRTLDDLGEMAGRTMEFSAEEFLAACDTILPAAGFKAKEQYAAAFLPDTYEFYWTSPADKVVGKLLEARNDYWTPERRKQAEVLGLTPVEVATVASIAEAESNYNPERGTIGRLYINRLNKGMKLQADPTVVFATGDFEIRRVLGKHLNIDSPYNTYKYAGLPPGPIRMPRAATITAILDEAPHEYLYMCAKEDFSGSHNFAKDYATHKENARRYQKALDERNIK